MGICEKSQDRTQWQLVGEDKSSVSHECPSAVVAEPAQRGNGRKWRLEPVLMRVPPSLPSATG